MLSIDEFREFESTNNLFDIKVNSVQVWPRVRHEVYRELKEKTGSGQAHSSIENGGINLFRGAKLWFRNIFYRNPFMADEADLLFLGHQRRKLESDGYWWDIYCDPIHIVCNLDSVHFEKNHLLEHRTPAKTPSLRYLDLIAYSGTILRKFGYGEVTFDESTKKELQNAEAQIAEEFEVEIDLHRKVKTDLQNRKCRLWLYERLIRKMDPEVVVLVVGYKNYTFVEACKRRGVPVVELQHGVIHDSHLGYRYPEHTSDIFYPDYLLTWGEYWNQWVSLPIPDERVIPVGFPYLEQTKKRYQGHPSGDQILFISQGTIGEELSKFALEVDAHSNIDHEIVYKLHPGEYDRWRGEYPWLIDADIEIIDSSEPPLYELFAKSSIQIGVGSTAIFEGLCFDLETYVYDLPGSSVLKPLVDEGAAAFISSVDELVCLRGALEKGFNREYYFESDASKNVCKLLQRLASGTST